MKFNRFVWDLYRNSEAGHAEESAVALIECKFDIETKKERKEAFVQAKSNTEGCKLFPRVWGVDVTATL